MALLDTLIIAGVLTFIVLLLWSKFQNQRIYDTVMEIRDILRDLGTSGTETIKK